MCMLFVCMRGSRNGWLVREPDSWSKGCELESRQERRENFLLQNRLCVLTLIQCPFHPRVTAVAPKGPRSFCQKYRWQVIPKHAYTLDPSKSEWADYAAVQAECGNLSGNELTRNSSGNTRSQSSQLAEPLWTDPCVKSGISLRELIPTIKKTTKKLAGGEWIVKRFPKILAHEEKATTITKPAKWNIWHFLRFPASLDLCFGSPLRRTAASVTPFAVSPVVEGNTL